MYRQAHKGFTLIELIVVIVILGILAATALPRFVDLSSDARGAALEGLKGALTSAATMAYGKAAIAGQTGGTGSITVGSTTISLVNGYPDAETIDDLLQDRAGATAAETATVTTYTLKTNCTVTYTEAAAGAAPAIAVTKTGC